MNDFLENLVWALFWTTVFIITVTWAAVLPTLSILWALGVLS